MESWPLRIIQVIELSIVLLKGSMLDYRSTIEDISFSGLSRTSNTDGSSVNFLIGRTNMAAFPAPADISIDELHFWDRRMDSAQIWSAYLKGINP